jgi:hypothetical protein
MCIYVYMDVRLLYVVYGIYLFIHIERRARLGGAHQSPTAGRNEMNSSNFFSYIFKIYVYLGSALNQKMKHYK